MCLIIIIQGSISLYNITREDFPRIALDVITISLKDPNKKPELINKQNSEKIDRVLSSIVEIDFYETKITYGQSFTKIQLKSGNNPTKVLETIKNRISQIDFSSTIDPPVIEELDTSSFPLISFHILFYSINDYSKIKEIENKLKFIP